MAFACVMSATQAQIYSYIDDPAGTYAGVATNATGTNLSRVNGLLADPACGIGFSSNKHTASGYGNGRPSVEFSVTPDAGYQLDVTAISVDIRRNLKGPASWRIAYSTDGGASWTNSGVDFAVANSNCFTTTNLTFDVTDFSTTSTVLVRIIGHTAYSPLNGTSTLRNITISGTVALADADGDGYTADVDCNDEDIAVNPGATEVCDGIDNNCDGNIDEAGGSTWYADADADTYGDAAMTTVACDMPMGYVADNTDCNDGDASINPGAIEVCDGIDNNCDGNTDEGLTFMTYYADGDGDSYGDAASTTSTCDGAPAGYVSDNTDCNDADGAINPGAVEVCDGIDNNCDGNIDEGIDLSISITPSGVIELCKPDEVTLEAVGTFDSYQWYKNGTPLAGETGASYTTNKPAYYQVEGFIGTCSSGLSAVQAVAVYESPNANIFYPDGLNLCDVSPLLLKASYDETYTYVWYKDGVEIPGATIANYSTSETGDYYCVITSAEGCTRTTATVTVVNECREGMTVNPEFSLYPNPVSDQLTISMPGLNTGDVADIIITDLTGKIVYSGIISANTNNIALGNEITNGLYVVTVTLNGLSTNQQIVVIK